MVGLIRILGAVIICISITDAKVEILTEETPYKPGIDLTLICKLEQFTETAHWMSNNDTIPIAYCLWTDCSLNPHYDEKYRFAFETDPEMFNLTIINLSLDDNGTELVCSDGSHSDSLRLIVSEDKHEDKTQDKKIQDKKIKDKKIQDTKIQVKKKVLKSNSAAKSTVPTVPVVAAAAAAVVAAAAVNILYIVFRNKLINCHIWNFLRGAKNSAGNRRNRTYDKKDVNKEEEIGFLNSNTETVTNQDIELDANMAEGGQLMNQADLSNSTGEKDKPLVENKENRNQHQDTQNGELESFEDQGEYRNRSAQDLDNINNPIGSASDEGTSTRLSNSPNPALLSPEGRQTDSEPQERVQELCQTASSADIETARNQSMKPEANITEEGALMQQADVGDVSNSTGTVTFARKLMTKKQSVVKTADFLRTRRNPSTLPNLRRGKLMTKANS